MPGRRLVEKSIYTTLGAGLIMYDAALDIMRDVVDSTRDMPDRGAKLIDDFYDRLDRQRDEINLRVEKEINKMADDYGLATKEDIKDIKAELKKISNKLSKADMTRHAPPPTPDM